MAFPDRNSLQWWRHLEVRGSALPGPRRPVISGPRRPVRPLQRVGDIDFTRDRRLSSGCAMSPDPDMSPGPRNVVLPWMVEGYGS
jgi:hypothetical protein